MNRIAALFAAVAAFVQCTGTPGTRFFEDDPVPQAPKGTVALFNGTDLDGWDVWVNDQAPHGDPASLFTVVDGAIHVSGEGLGGITTRDAYKNYHLTMEYRFVGDAYYSRVGNTADGGLLFHCVGPEGLGYSNTWHISFECNLIQGRTGDLILVNNNPDYMHVLAASATVDSLQRWTPEGGRALSQEGSGRVNNRYFDPTWEDIDSQPVIWPEKEYGEWNTIELICREDTADYIFNGVLVNRLTGLRPAGGRIQLQSENHGIEYRNIYISEL
ncbi:MAG: DUF1080 domain-containing protein [Bacteroidales bacterium]|nr:DUF1080 domain-containing protein [Bacteroidales bacterium]